jgi:predicted RNA methylase
VARLDLISHSASRAQLEFVFGPAVLMRGAAAKDRLRGATIVDVGSRLGAVLYVAYARTHAKEIVGIESSAYWCGVQRDIVEKKFPQLAQRVRVVEGDVRESAQLLARADVVILNNPFEYFVASGGSGSADSELALWQFLRRSVSKRGAKLVTLPSLEETFARLGKTVADDLKLGQWVRHVAIDYPPADQCEGDAGEDLRQLHLYVVL